MITPIKPLEMNTLKSNSEQNKSFRKEKVNTYSMEWYCERCNHYFKIPGTVNTKSYQEDTKSNKQLNCPYCGNLNITNNFKNKRGREWEV